MFDQQHQRNNTVLFCGLESENGCATDFIADSGRDIASDYKMKNKFLKINHDNNVMISQKTNEFQIIIKP